MRAIILLLVFVNAIPCFAANALVVSAEDDGGMSGGGGGITTPANISVEQVRLAAADSQLAIRLWFQAREYDQYRTDDLPSSYFKLFNRERDIFFFISQTPIRVREHSPCLSPQGLPVDASVAVDKDGFATICLSAFTLTKKLNEYNYQFEIAALVLHELSHALGTDEEEATALQKQSIAIFRYLNFSELREELRPNGWAERQNVFGRVMNYVRNVKEYPPAESPWSFYDNNLFGAFEHSRRSLFGDWPEGTMSYLRPMQRDYYEDLWIKASGLMGYVCSIDQTDYRKDERQWCMDRYNKIFGTDSVLDTIEFWNRQGYYTMRRIDPKSLSQTISKVTDTASFLRELDEIDSMARGLKYDFDQMYEGKFRLKD